MAVFPPSSRALARFLLWDQCSTGPCSGSVLVSAVSQFLLIPYDLNLPRPELSQNWFLCPAARKFDHPKDLSLALSLKALIHSSQFFFFFLPVSGQGLYRYRTLQVFVFV